MEISVGEDYQDIPAMHEMAVNLKAELKLTSEESMMKMIKKKQKSQKEEGVLSPDSIPEKITK
jgi:pseudouridine-5'-phosphate glycosidase